MKMNIAIKNREEIDELIDKMHGHKEELSELKGNLEGIVPNLTKHVRGLSQTIDELESLELEVEVTRDK